MNRDMDAIRQILLTVQNADGIVREVEGMNNDVFMFNAMLLIEAGYLLGSAPKSGRRSILPASVFIERLTWEGFEFADSIKDDTLWEKAKNRVLTPAGSWTVGIFAEYVKHEILHSLGID